MSSTRMLFAAAAAALVVAAAAVDRVQGLSSPAAAVADSKRMNVLFLMSDSHDGRTLDPTDGTVFPAQHLPNLERLAKRGTNFVRTYAHSPQCTPSRSSMYTGRVGFWARAGRGGVRGGAKRRACALAVAEGPGSTLLYSSLA